MVATNLTSKTIFDDYYLTRAKEEIETVIIYCVCCQKLLQGRTLQKKKSMTVGARTKSHPMEVRLTLVLLKQHSVVFSWHNWLGSSAARRTRSCTREKKHVKKLEKEVQGTCLPLLTSRKAGLLPFCSSVVSAST